MYIPYKLSRPIDCVDKKRGWLPRTKFRKVVDKISVRMTVIRTGDKKNNVIFFTGEGGRSLKLADWERSNEAQQKPSCVSSSYVRGAEVEVDCASHNMCNATLYRAH